MSKHEGQMARLSPLQRAYWMGYRRAKIQMRRELHEMARRLDDELAELADEMQGTRDEFHRLKAIERAIDTERDGMPDRRSRLVAQVAPAAGDPVRHDDSARSPTCAT